MRRENELHIRSVHVLVHCRALYRSIYMRTIFDQAFARGYYSVYGAGMTTDRTAGLLKKAQVISLLWFSYCICYVNGMVKYILCVLTFFSRFDFTLFWSFSQYIYESRTISLFACPAVPLPCPWFSDSLVWSGLVGLVCLRLVLSQHSLVAYLSLRSCCYFVTGLPFIVESIKIVGVLFASAASCGYSSKLLSGDWMKLCESKSTIN